jgi:hypothetical protein
MCATVSWDAVVAFSSGVVGDGSGEMLCSDRGAGKGDWTCCGVGVGMGVLVGSVWGLLLVGSAVPVLLDTQPAKRSTVIRMPTARIVYPRFMVTS